MQTRTISASVFTVLMGTYGLASDMDKAGVEKKLIAQYTLTQPTADNTDIVIAGSVLVLQTSNLMMAPVTSTNFYQNTYKDGKITQNAAGKMTNALGRFSRLPGASAPAAPATRTYVRGEKMWVTKIEVKDDGVTFDLFTDAVADVRYKAALKFPWTKGIALTSDQVEKLVAEVFKVQPAEETKDNAPPQQEQQAAPAAAPAPGRKRPAPAAAPAAAPPPEAPPPPAAEAAPPPIPPPPPPVDEAPPKTVKVGETKDNVVADFGQPDKIAKVGTKEIYFYKDFKVTFVGGKVTDIQ
jgi:hypothetical protein